MVTDRKAMAEALRKRTEESSTRRTGGFVSIFRNDLDDVKFWKVAEGDHIIDIIPYYAGPFDPHVAEGEPQYVLMLKVHQGIGVEGGNYICPTNYKKPCPICEHIKRLKSEGADEEEINALYPKNRCVYNIVCYDSDKEENKGVQVWEFSHWYSERYFTKLATPKRRRGGEQGGGRISFADLDDGKSIEFTREGTGQTNTNFYGFALKDRNYAIDDEIADSTHCLDELISILSYDELYRIYWGEDAPEEGSSEEKPRRTRPVRREESTPTQREEKTSRREEEPEPTREGRRTRPVRREEEPPFEKDKNTCPGGGTFGVDVDKLEHCEDCEIWKACARESAKSLRSSDTVEKEPKTNDTGEDKAPEAQTSRRRRRG